MRGPKLALLLCAACAVSHAAKKKKTTGTVTFPEPDDIVGLVKVAKKGSSEQKLKAVKAISYLAESQAKAVIEAGGAKPLVTLLQNGGSTYKDAVLTALLRLAIGHKEEGKEAIIAAGAIKPLVALMRHDPYDDNNGGKSVQKVIQITGSLCMTRAGRAEVIKMDGVQKLLALMVDDDFPDQTRTSAVRTIAALAQEPAGRKIIIDLKGVPSMVHYMAESDDEWAEEAVAHAIGSLAAGDKITRIQVGVMGGLAAMVRLAAGGGGGNDKAKEYAMLAIGNLAIDPQNKKILVGLAASNVILDMFMNGPTPEIRQKAKMVMMNLAHTGNEDNEDDDEAVGEYDLDDGVKSASAVDPDARRDEL